MGQGSLTLATWLLASYHPIGECDVSNTANSSSGLLAFAEKVHRKDTDLGNMFLHPAV
jgi:hypothetical protein